MRLIRRHPEADKRPKMRADGNAREMHGVGTGFIVTADGQIVPNAHVVDGAEKVSVTLADGRKVDGKVLGVDTATDIALIKINKDNSGGPLFNASVEVVGINSALFSLTGGSAGIRFAVPSETASKVWADVVGDGKVERGWLGVQFLRVSDDIAATLCFDRAEGVLITEVTADTPAAKAGLARGDVVLRVGGTQVKDPRDLTRMIVTDAPGSEVKLGLLRAGKPVDATVALGTRPRTTGLIAALPTWTGARSQGRSFCYMAELADPFRNLGDWGERAGSTVG